MSKRIWLLIAALAACTDAHGPKTGTQTGNPPVLDRGRVTLEVSADEVHITGEPGAVTPGGARIEITNLTTGEVTEGTAATDGSFDIRVDGSLNDTFVVRALAGGESSAPVYVVRGGAAVTGGDAGVLSCEQYEELAAAALEESAASAEQSCSRDADCEVVVLTASCAVGCEPVYVNAASAEQIGVTSHALEDGLCAAAFEAGCPRKLKRCPLILPASCIGGQCAAAGQLSCQERGQKHDAILSEAIAAADRSCSRDSDCVTASTSTECQTRCSGVPVSRAGQADIEAAVVAINAGVCANFEASGCGKAQIDCALPQEAHCVSGQCTHDNPLPDGGVPDCVDCLSEPLQWGWDLGAEGPTYDDLSVVAPCARYVHRRVSRFDRSAEIARCELDLVACNAAASTGAIMNALANDDVQRAFAESPAEYGVDPELLDASSFRIALGDRRILVGGSCEGAPPNCIPPPAGVQTLVELLEGVDETLLATEACAEFPR